MKYKLSVIVPVYNKEQYIDSGLSSLLHQTLINDMEIVIVDDGSNSKTGKRLKDFCQEYKNFKYNLLFAPTYNARCLPPLIASKTYLVLAF